MGRAFEYRKATKMKRWAGMAKAFTRVGRQIALAVKSGGPDPNYNPRLRMAIQNAKAANMPKANVDNAIKKASSKESENYEEVIYEGYAPHGIAVLVETATDNPTRTVANVRHVFSKYGGSLGTSGSVSYMFSHKAVFVVAKTAIGDRDEFELEMIDAGLAEIREEDDQVLLYAAFSDFGTLNKALEDKGIEIQESRFDREPSMLKKLTDEEVEEVIKLIEKMEEDDDVQNVFHTMDMSE
ncbi:MAG: YebC/PmpR family DNA-binding transcriptional regulator [Saprospiraceae bacterium]|nr:YebC/PmpR family DNA-binding transcriptional regulator [Saprospiraceae bacterium]